MKRLASFIFLVLAFASGMLWQPRSEPDNATSPPQTTSSLPTAASGLAARSAAQKLTDRLIQGGWAQATAEIFSSATGNLTTSLLDSPMALMRLAALGRRQGVGSFIRECPEAAALVALSKAPEALVQGLMTARTTAEKEALLSSCLLCPCDEASRDWALALQAQGRLIAKLLEQTTPDFVRKVMVVDRTVHPAAAQAYDEWVVNCLMPGGSLANEAETVSRLLWLQNTGAVVRSLLATRPGFADQLRKSWPALRASITTRWTKPGQPCWHRLPPNLWNLLAARPTDALALVEAQGPGVCEFFCGDKAPPDRVHSALAGAFLGKRQVLASFILLFAPHEDFQGVCQQTPFHLLEPACAYLANLGSETAVRERLSNWNHEPAKLEADVIPNAVLEKIPGGPILSLADKLWNGRITTAGDYGAALISAYSIYCFWDSASTFMSISHDKGLTAAAKVMAEREAPWVAAEQTVKEIRAQLPADTQRALGLLPPKPLQAPAAEVNSPLLTGGQAIPAAVEQLRNTCGHAVLRATPHRYVVELPQQGGAATDRLYAQASELATAAAEGVTERAWQQHFLSYTLWLLDQP